MKALTVSRIEIREEFAEECKGLLVEGVHHSRWILIQTYHQLGEMIRKESGKTPISDFTASLAETLGRSERIFWYAVKLYDCYPDINTIPEGKNISMYKLIKNYLTDGKSEPPEHEVCPTCKGRGWIDS